MPSNEARPILIIEDEASLAETIRYNLEREDFVVEEASDGRRGLERFRSTDPALVILDLMLPELSGLDVCRAIRAESSVPILILTAKDSEADVVAGLELGADDYVTKPFSPRELAARVRTVLRRAEPHAVRDERLAFGDLELDAGTREVRRAGSPLKLTAKEFDLLWFLASHPRHVFSRSQLMDRVWGYESALDTGTVTVHVRRLREKIEEDPAQPKLLETVWGVGYRLIP